MNEEKITSEYRTATFGKAKKKDFAKAHTMRGTLDKEPDPVLQKKNSKDRIRVKVDQGLALNKRMPDYKSTCSLYIKNELQIKLREKAISSLIDQGHQPSEITNKHIATERNRIIEQLIDKYL